MSPRTLDARQRMRAIGSNFPIAAVRLGPSGRRPTVVCGCHRGGRNSIPLNRVRACGSQAPIAFFRPWPRNTVSTW